MWLARQSHWSFATQPSHEELHKAYQNRLSVIFRAHKPSAAPRHPEAYHTSVGKQECYKEQRNTAHTHTPAQTPPSRLWPRWCMHPARGETRNLWVRAVSPPAELSRQCVPGGGRSMYDVRQYQTKHSDSRKTTCLSNSLAKSPKHFKPETFAHRKMPGVYPRSLALPKHPAFIKILVSSSFLCPRHIAISAVVLMQVPR